MPGIGMMIGWTSSPQPCRTAARTLPEGFSRAPPEAASAVRAPPRDGAGQQADPTGAAELLASARSLAEGTGVLRPARTPSDLVQRHAILHDAQRRAREFTPLRSPRTRRSFLTCGTPR